MRALFTSRPSNESDCMCEMSAVLFCCCQPSIQTDVFSSISNASRRQVLVGPTQQIDNDNALTVQASCLAHDMPDQVGRMAAIKSEVADEMEAKFSSSFSTTDRQALCIITLAVMMLVALLT